MFLISVLTCTAQNAPPEWHNALNLTNKFNDVLLADSLGNSYFLTSNKDGDLFIEKQGSGDSKSAFSTKIISATKGEPNYRRVLVLDDGFAVISSVHDKTAATFTFFENTVGLNGELKSPTAKEILEFPYNKKEGEGTSQFLISPDKKRIAISYRAPQSSDFTFYLFDGAFNSLGTEKGSINKNSKHGLVAASDFAITNAGDIVYTAEKITIHRKDWEGVENWLFILSSKSDNVDSVALKCPDGMSFMSMDILVTQKDVVVVAFYSEKFAPRGIYFGKYSLESATLTTSTTELTKEMYVTPGALDVSKGKVGLYRGAITIIPTSTGYYIVNDPIAGQASSSPNGMSSVMYTLYTMNVISITGEGKIDWINSIFRYQRCTASSGLLGAFGVSTSVMLREDDFSLFGNSYTMIGDELVILMNDARGNTPQSGSSKEIVGATKPKDITANIIRVSNNGSFTKTITTAKSGAETRWHVGYSYMGEGFIYTIGEDGENVHGVVVN